MIRARPTDRSRAARVRRPPPLRRGAAIVCVAALLVSADGAALSSPLPPPRPADLDAQEPSLQPPEGPDRSCIDRLRLVGARAETASQPSTRPECAVDTPVRLVAVSSGGRSIALPDRPIVACRFAIVFAEWLGKVAASSLTVRRKTFLASVTTGPGFDCRFRNRAASGKMSVHGQGLALDVSVFTFADRTRLSVATGSDDSGFQEARAAACGRFNTVLGPGSDRFHSDHLHLDIQRHGPGGSYRICK